MTPTIRNLLTSFLIAAVAPVGLAVLDLETPAFAKNGGGNGGGHGGGNGHGGDHGNSGHSNGGSNHANAKTADASDDTDTTEAEDEGDDSLSTKGWGKLNGVMHASQTAIAHASTNSPIGTARAFGQALGGFLGQTPATEDTATGENTTAQDDVSIEDLGAMMAKMTNKPVTAEQVEAVANKVGIESEEQAAPTGDTTQDTTTDETGDEGTAPKLDDATAQAIADSANAIHDGTAEGDDTADDGNTADAGDDADAGETGDDTVSD